MNGSYIVVKYYPDESRTYEVFEDLEGLLAYVVQEKGLGSKICVWKFGECIGDFS
jgi:hypothetical protein